MLMQESNGDEGNSNMQWLKSNMRLLPIYLSARVQNLESFERDILFPPTWANDENFQSVAPHREGCRKNSYLDVVSGVFGFIIWSSFDRVELLMIHIIP